MKAVFCFLLAVGLPGCAVTDTARGAMERCKITRELIVETGPMRSFAHVLCDDPGVPRLDVPPRLPERR